MVFYENSGLQNLYDIIRYCQSKRECRRSAFFRHFAEPLQDCNEMCDNCSFSSEVKEMDASGHAKVMLSLLQDIQENDQRLTMLQLVDKMKVKNKGAGPELKKDELEQLVIQLILDRVLKEEFQHTAYSTNAYVTVGPLANQVLQGKKIVKIESSRQKNSMGQVKSSKRNRSSGLELKLDELRRELSSIHGGIFPHSVLSTQQIGMLSTQKPISMEQLEKIIGKLKTEKYGCKILEEIKRYESKNEYEDENVHGSSSGKRLKSKEAIVVESSEDDA